MESAFSNKDEVSGKKEYSEDICLSSNGRLDMEGTRVICNSQQQNLRMTGHMVEDHHDIRSDAYGATHLYKGGCTSPFVRDRQELLGISKKDKISRRKLFRNEEEISPVLGLRIVPAKEYIARCEEDNSPDGKHKQIQDNGKASEKTNITSPSGEPVKTTETPIFPGFACKLCRAMFSEPLQLAQHKCARIENVKYDCPECGKSFSCPANLASHRRWHRPKKSIPDNGSKSGNSSDKSNQKEQSAVKILKQMMKSSRTSAVLGDITSGGDVITERKEPETLSEFSRSKSRDQDAINFHTCPVCHKSFRRKSYLKHHIATKHSSLSFCNLTAHPGRPVSCGPIKDKSIVRDSHESILRITDKVPVYPEEGLAGLAALAYAAEFHSKLLPLASDGISANIPCGRRDQNVSIREKNTGSKTNNLKRSCEPAESLLRIKKSKIDDVPCDFNRNAMAKKSSWLPPSPPISEISRSPGFIASEDSEEGECDEKRSVNLSQTDKTENDVKDSKNIPKRPTDCHTITSRSVAMPLQCFPELSQIKPSDIVGLHRQSNLTNVSALRFNEPFHPYPYHCGIIPNGRMAFIPTWNSWGNHASWKGIHHFPSVMRPPALRISK